MKSKLLAALLLATAAPAIAQTSITSLPPPALVDPKVAELRDNALNNDHYAWDVVEGLTTEVGQRLAATEAEARARDWAVQRLKAMGKAIKSAAKKGRLVIVHGTPLLNTVYWTEDRSDDFCRKMAAIVALKSGDVIAFGHTHKPWHRAVDGVHFVNTGSVGRPKDGDWRAGYVRLELGRGEVGAEFVRVGYDVADDLGRAADQLCRAPGQPGAVVTEQHTTGTRLDRRHGDLLHDADLGGVRGVACRRGQSPYVGARQRVDDDADGRGRSDHSDAQQRSGDGLADSVGDAQRVGDVQLFEHGAVGHRRERGGGIARA